MAALGHPESGQKFIHVAGTNGKGSVCAYTAQALEDNGYKVAMFTSPHLVRINERFKINGQDIDDETMLKAFHQVYDLFQGGHPELEHASYFEFIFLMGMLIFSWEKVARIFCAARAFLARHLASCRACKSLSSSIKHSFQLSF